MNQNEGKDHAPHVHAISNAHDAASIESSKRMRSYGIKMGLRAIFFVSGALIAAYWNIWVGLALLAASAVLPWIAVMDANLIHDGDAGGGASYVDAPPADALESPVSEDEAPDDDLGPDTIDGEWVEDEPGPGTSPSTDPPPEGAGRGEAA